MSANVVTPLQAHNTGSGIVWKCNNRGFPHNGVRGDQLPDFRALSLTISQTLRVVFIEGVILGLDLGPRCIKCLSSEYDPSSATSSVEAGFAGSSDSHHRSVTSTAAQ